MIFWGGGSTGLRFGLGGGEGCLLVSKAKQKSKRQIGWVGNHPFGLANEEGPGRPLKAWSLDVAFGLGAVGT